MDLTEDYKLLYKTTYSIKKLYDVFTNKIAFLERVYVKSQIIIPCTSLFFRIELCLSVNALDLRVFTIRSNLLARSKTNIDKSETLFHHQSDARLVFNFGKFWLTRTVTSFKPETRSTNKRKFFIRLFVNYQTIVNLI